jgi:hypothetical protein
MYNFADSSVTASAFTSGANTALTLVATTAGLTTTAALVIYYDDQLASTTVTVSSIPTISGTVTVGNTVSVTGGLTDTELRASPFTIYPTQPPSPLSRLQVDISDGSGNAGYGTTGTPLKISGSVTIGAGTGQIGSVTASISGTVPISISSVTVGNSVTIGSLPALVAGTAQIGSVTASISNTVVTFYPLQGTTVTNSNFTSTTASITLVSAVAGREVLTVFNEGAGNLHISPGATCTTIAYQVRLSAGDYWECPAGQLSLAHTAVFATAGTARVTEVS